MNVGESLKYIFSVDTKSSNRIIIYFLGIKIRFLKPGVKKSALEYMNLTCPVSQIPKATGVLRKVQLANLKLLQIFDKLCEDNNFEYWLDYGNLLGAVRHRGFIPWDDDIDVSMMRDDYERFIKFFEKGLSDYKDLVFVYDNNGKNKCFVKIKHKSLGNIALDIFPNDFYYKKTNPQEKKYINSLLYKIMHNPFSKFLYPFFISRPQSLRKRFLRITQNKILKGNILDKTEKPDVFCSIDYPHQHKHLIFDYETIFPLKKIFFEGYYFYGPNNPEKYLELKYGNYMKLPNNCYPHHINTEGFDEEQKIILNDFIKGVENFE